MPYTVWLVFGAILGIVYSTEAQAICDHDRRSSTGPHWSPLGPSKCIHVFARLSTFDDATNLCAKVHPNATLLTIANKEDQQLLEQFFSENYINEAVWLGAKKAADGMLRWTATGVELSGTFTNWERDQPKSLRRKACVQMATADGSRDAFRWSSLACSKKNLVVCERGPSQVEGEPEVSQSRSQSNPAVAATLLDLEKEVGLLQTKAAQLEQLVKRLKESLNLGIESKDDSEKVNKQEKAESTSEANLPAEVPFLHPNTTDQLPQVESVTNLTRSIWNTYWYNASANSNVSAETIIAALSTLKVMGLEEEFKQGRDWLKANIDFEKLPVNNSEGEGRLQMISQTIGGLLSAYALTGDTEFVTMVKPLVNRLVLNFASFKFFDRDHALSTEGRLGVEHTYFGALSGQRQYAFFTNMLHRHLQQKLRKSNGLYFETINRDGGGGTLAQLDSLAPYLDVLLQLYIQSAGQNEDALLIYSQAVDALAKAMIDDDGKLLKPNETMYNVTNSPMDTCMLGATLQQGIDVLKRLNESEVNSLEGQQDLAANLQETCDQMTKAKSPFSLSSYPQIVEEYHWSPQLARKNFILWRLTQKILYRLRALEMMETIARELEVGSLFSSDHHSSQLLGLITNSTSFKQTAFLSATLKYLYLTFTEDTVLPLQEQWIFNSAGHPLPVCGKVSTFKEDCSMLWNR